jgi:BioD-like phosphotransacetylase family protein
LQKLEEDDGKSPLILSHYTRNDVILGYLSHWQKCKARGKPWTGALILATGSEERRIAGDRAVHSHIMDTIKAMNVPVMCVNLTTFGIMQKLDSFTPKLHFEDTDRVRVACDHMSSHIDFATLVERMNR